MAYQREQEEPDLSKETIFVGKRRALGIGALSSSTLIENGSRSNTLGEEETIAGRRPYGLCELINPLDEFSVLDQIRAVGHNPVLEQL
jgi:hypothetical protein